MVPSKLEICECGVWFAGVIKQRLEQIKKGLWLTSSFLKGAAGHTDPPLEAAQHPGL